MKKILVVVLALAVACMCLVSCGGGDFEGKWECESMNLGGMTITDSFFGIPVGIMMQLEIKADGKGIQYEYDNGETKENSFKWEADGKNLTIKQGGDEIEFKLKDDKLVAEYTEDGQTVSVTLKKVKSFTEFDADELLGAFGGDD